MSFALTESQRRWVDIATKLAASFRAASDAADETASFPRENFDRMREAGLLKLAVPRAYGGEGEVTGNAHLTAYLVSEAIARGCSTTGWDLIIHFHQCGAVARIGNEEQKSRILGDVARNGALMGSLGSEINFQQMAASADTARTVGFAADMQRVEGGFLASASKHFCSNAPVADYMLYWSMAPGTTSSSDGLSLSIVTKDSPGLSFSDQGWSDMIGLRGSVSWSAKLVNVFIPDQNVLGEPGDFIQKDPYTLELSQSFHLLGAAQGAFDFVLEVLRTRPFLKKEEGLMVLIGQMGATLQAARASSLYANHLWEQGQFGDAAAASLRAHHTASEAALLISTKGFEIVGTRALLKTQPLERFWRDIRAASLHTRASQLLRLAADASVDGHYAPKQKYGAPAPQRSWAELGFPLRRGQEVAA